VDGAKNLNSRNVVKSDRQYILRMFRFMKPYALPYAISQFVYIGQGFAIQFILALFTGNIMAAIMNANASMINDAILAFATMALTFFVVLGICIYVNIIVTEKAMLDMKRSLFRAFMRKGIEDTSHSGESIAAINTDADAANGVFQGSLSAFLNSAFTIIASPIVIFAIDWRLGAAAFVVGLVSLAAQHRFAAPLAKISEGKLLENGESLKVIGNMFSGAMSVRAYNAQEKVHSNFERHNKLMKMLDFRQAFISMWQGVFTTLQGWLSLIVVFGFGGWLVAVQSLAFNQLMVSAGMCAALISAIGKIGKLYADLQPSIVGAKRVFAVLDNYSHHGSCASSNNSCGIASSDNYTLCLENLSFNYKGSGEGALKDINLVIEENKKIAIVGESGSGKSTLLRVIVGLYQREDLVLRIGSTLCSQVPIQSWRKNFSYVDQSCNLFNLSVKENITLGSPEELRDDQIIAAARRAVAHDFIQALSSGYDTLCGEKGDLISGGQKQRIAIARALVKGAPIIVFDEPTSALDKETEAQVMATIDTLRNDHTILIATHNLENAINADSIVVLNKGAVAEVGTHQELMDAKGEYCRLYARSTYSYDAE